MLRPLQNQKKSPLCSPLKLRGKCRVTSPLLILLGDRHIETQSLIPLVFPLKIKGEISFLLPPLLILLGDRHIETQSLIPLVFPLKINKSRPENTPLIPLLKEGEMSWYSPPLFIREGSVLDFCTGLMRMIQLIKDF
jgi:hypothetical protein